MTENLDNFLTPAQLAGVLGLSEFTIRSDVSRRPSRLPPRFLKPGSSALLWDKKTVEAWQAAQEL